MLVYQKQQIVKIWAEQHKWQEYIYKYIHIYIYKYIYIHIYIYILGVCNNSGGYFLREYLINRRASPHTTITLHIISTITDIRTNKETYIRIYISNIYIYIYILGVCDNSGGYFLREYLITRRALSTDWVTCF